jgi:peptidoglycan/LPS O-acetylase OafA/YrhL
MRALAILSVILYHDRLYRFGPVSTGWFQAYGSKGVDLFFAISGLLICWRLMEEEQRSGSISIKKFYIRRTFRILPPALACLGVIGMLGLTGVLDIGLKEWLGGVFFLRNYTSLLGPFHPGWHFTEHYWSLSVEEHFYLLMPALLVFTKPRYGCHCCFC